MRILVTGGAGFIGSHVVDGYVGNGHEVVVIDNFSTGRRENINPKAKVYEIDICDPQIAEVFKQETPEILNHHAAQVDVRISVANPKYDLKVNVEGLINLLEAGKDNGLKKVIFASSAAVYGEQKHFPAREDHQTCPVNPYGISKLVAEKYLQLYKHMYGLDWVALRYANVYGPRQGVKGEAGVVAIFAKKMLSGGQPIIFGDGAQTRDFIYVGDVVEANCAAMRENAYGVYNVGTGIETDVKSVFCLLKELSGSDCKIAHGQAVAGEQRRSVLSSGRLRSELSWDDQTQLTTGYRCTVDWFHNCLIDPNSDGSK